MIGLSRMISLAARGGVNIEDILDQLKSCGVCPSYAVRSATKKDCSVGSCCPVAVGNALRDMHREIQNIICECKGDVEIDLYTERKTPKGYKLSPIIVNPISELNTETKEIISMEECPNCHEKTLIHQGGCINCSSCSYCKCE